MRTRKQIGDDIDRLRAARSIYVEALTEAQKRARTLMNTGVQEAMVELQKRVDEIGKQFHAAVKEWNDLTNGVTHAP